MSIADDLEKKLAEDLNHVVERFYELCEVADIPAGDTIIRLMTIMTSGLIRACRMYGREGIENVVADAIIKGVREERTMHGADRGTT